jgi:hypothetical protein
MSSGLPRNLPFHQLEEITAGFSKERKLGNGAFGEVYMVSLFWNTTNPYNGRECNHIVIRE